MKKIDKVKDRIENNINSKKYLETDKIKTTNVNILLNRVRLDKKKNFKKKLYLFFALFSIIAIIISFL